MLHVVFFFDAIGELMNTRVYSDLVETLEKGREERDNSARAFCEIPAGNFIFVHFEKLAARLYAV